MSAASSAALWLLFAFCQGMESLQVEDPEWQDPHPPSSPATCNAMSHPAVPAPLREPGDSGLLHMPVHFHSLTLHHCPKVVLENVAPEMTNVSALLNGDACSFHYAPGHGLTAASMGVDTFKP